jgi:hypothetical protein
VGGAVRDAILGKRPKDFDLATDAKPDEVLKIAKQGGLKTYEVGKAFGVVVVGGHEIATFRKDIGKGRRPKAVDFSDIKGDVNRRDLTINALFYDMGRDEIVDLTGGLEDLKKKIIRTVGVAKERFDEDPLRKLRALRFQAVVGGKMDKDTEKALMINPSLKGVSFERIREEFIKGIKKGKNPKLFMEALDKFGFTKQMFPNLKLQKPYPQVNDYILFLSMMLRKNDLGKLGKKLNSLKYTGSDVNNITFLIYLHQHFKPEVIYITKKMQEKTTLTKRQIVVFGGMIGKDFRKLVKFNLSVKGGGKEFVGLKGKEIGDKIKELEKRLYLGESYKNFTFGPDWIPTSLAQRKKMKRIHRKTNRSMREAPRVPRKKGQHRGSSSHSDLYTDENPKGTIHGLKFATVDDAKKSVTKIKNSGKTHAHKIQAAVAMEQRAREMGKTAQASVYRKYINQMKKKTKEKNEMAIPSPSRAGINKNKTDRMSGYKKVEEIAVRPKPKKFRDIYNALPSDLKKRVMNLKNYDQRRDYHPEGNVLKHTIAVTNRALRTGDIDFALSALFHDIGKDSTAKIHPKKGFWTHYGHEKVSAKLVKKYSTWIKSMGGNVDTIYYIVSQHSRMKVFDKMKWTKQDKMRKDKDFGKLKKFSKTMDKGGRGINDGKIKKLQKELDSYMESVVYLGMENGDIATISEQKIKRVIGVYGGRFQPFGPHHLKTYKWLKSKVDDAYITTSDIKKPPRHPMNFKEKVRHMSKMGVPANRIVKETSPYVAKNLLKKFGEDTAVVYIFGKKDAGRLSGGKKKDGSPGYFQDYKKSKGNIKSHMEHGYFLVAPHVSMKIGGNEISGTTMRNILGSPKIEDKDRPKIFKKLFGYYDKGVYNMLTNKFKKLFEFYNQQSVKDIIKEVSAFNAAFKGSDLSDEGLYDFFNSFADYKRVSPEKAEILGWEVVGDIIGKKAKDPSFEFTYEADRVDTVTFGKTINQNTSNEDSVDNPFPKYRAHMTQMAKMLGMEIVKFFGKPTAKMKDSLTHDMKTSVSGVSKIKKIQESFENNTKELLLMGGAYGHMSHPFDDNNLTFSDLKQIIINGIGGKLDREDGVTEKLDGQNLMVCWIDGKLRAARNKGHLKNFGKTAPDTNGIKSIFKGRGNIEKAFVNAMKDLSKSIGSLSDKQKEKIFGNGKRWMNLEVMYPATANVIDYDVAEIIFHGTLEYDESGRPIGQPKDSARMLAGMIKQVNQNVQKTFKIGKPNFLKVPKHQNFDKLESKYLGRLNKLQRQYGLSDKDTLGEYHEAYWREYVFNASKQFGVKLKPAQFAKLIRRWAYFDKSYKIQEIRKDFGDNEKFLDWILNTDKFDHNKIFKDNIKPFEVLFFDVGAQILKNISGYIAVNPDKAVQKIRKEVNQALKDLQKPDKIEKLKKLKLQIQKLQKIGGMKSIVPTEGIVFKYKGKVYKFTGAFAPINQILGSLKFG